MRFGVCIGGDAGKIATAKAVGFDYVEAGFSLLTTENTEEFDRYAAELQKNDIRCESVNCFIPGHLPVVADTVNEKGLYDYVKKGMENGVKLGVKTVVFGSGGARRIPEGFPYEKAVRQTLRFLREIAGPLAEENGITVVLEPLSPRDTNFINTAKEGAVIAAAADHPAVKSLVDLFHMEKVGDTNADILAIGPMIRHAHIAEPSQRVYPSTPDEFDYKGFVAALESVGCPRCSVEANCRDFETDSRAAARLLQSL